MDSRLDDVVRDLWVVAVEVTQQGIQLYAVDAAACL